MQNTWSGSNAAMQSALGHNFTFMSTTDLDPISSISTINDSIVQLIKRQSSKNTHLNIKKPPFKFKEHQS